MITNILFKLPKAFVIKARSLFAKHTREITEMVNGNNSLSEDDDLFSHQRRIIFTLLVASGSIIILNRLGLKYLIPKVRAKDRKDALKLKKALIQTHTPEQKHLWEEIERSQKSPDSLTAIVKESFKERALEKNIIKKLTVVMDLILSDKSAKIHSSSKWLNMQIDKYEKSLNHNQIVIYKNLFETEFKILHKVKVVKVLLYVGLPIIIYNLVALTKAKDLREWESSLEKIKKRRKKYKEKFNK